MYKSNKEIIFEALGEVSAVFMSQEIKGTEIVMPTEELTKIGNELLEKLAQIRQNDLKGLVEWAEKKRIFWQQQNTYEGNEEKVYRTTIIEIFGDLIHHLKYPNQVNE